jgi:hypothetical protein
MSSLLSELPAKQAVNPVAQLAHGPLLLGGSSFTDVLAAQHR